MTILINKNHLFNEDMIKNFEMIEYINSDDETIYVESETFRHYEMLKAHLRIEGINIDISSGYRSLEKQENIFLDFMNKYGMDYAEEVVAMPGYSEHHSGLALDICLFKDGKLINGNDELIKCVDEFNKIHSVLKYFGFILRYPKGKENITGFSYEPWHIRYVGDYIAMNIENKTLEEF